MRIILLLIISTCFVLQVVPTTPWLKSSARRNGKCYKFVDAPAMFYQALASCAVDHGGQLATIKSLKQNLIIKGLIWENGYYQKHLWVAGQTTSRYQWFWQYWNNGTQKHLSPITFKDWATNTNFLADQCIYLEATTSKWQLAGCRTVHYAYVCELPSCHNPTNDVNECDTTQCSEQETCVNLPGSYTCNCKLGFVRVMGNCTDANECIMSPQPCHSNAYCTNAEGSFTCTCKDGYQFSDGWTCNDIDECAGSGYYACNNIGKSCFNTAGSYVCY